MKKKIKFYILWIIFQIYSQTVFKIERMFYRIFKNKNIKRRVFLTSGNISLISVLTFLKQYPEEDVEDILVIDTGWGKQEFIDVNLDVASMHNFKRKIVSINTRIFFTFMKYNIFQIDEIYMHPKMDYTRYLMPMFKDCKFNIFDEGIASLIEQSHPNNIYIDKMYTMNYCNKFDKLGYKNIQQISLDVEIFKQIAGKISKKLPFDIEIQPNSKTILFCSSYWFAFDLGKEGYYDYQNRIIQKLLEQGFNVIYKQHPRETDDVSIPEGAIKTNCLLPIELYNLDILAIVSIASTASLHSFYYWDIPGFVDVNDKTITCDKKFNIYSLVRLSLKEYLPNISKLLEINANEYSYRELKAKFTKICEDKIKEQVHLSENKVLKEQFDNLVK